MYWQQESNMPIHMHDMIWLDSCGKSPKPHQLDAHLKPTTRRVQCDPWQYAWYSCIQNMPVHVISFCCGVQHWMFFIMSYYFKRSFVLQCPISYSSRILYVGIYMLISTRFIVWLSICHLLVGIFVSNNFDKWMNTRVVLTSVFSIFTEPISNAKVFRMHLLFDFVSFLVVYWFSLYVGYDI